MLYSIMTYYNILWHRRRRLPLRRRLRAPALDVAGLRGLRLLLEGGAAVEAGERHYMMLYYISLYS